MNTFTDEDGNTYELEHVTTGMDGYVSYTIKPLQPAEAKHVMLLKLGYEGYWPYSEDIELTKSQATALADAIKALVEYIQKPSSENIATLRSKAMDAAESLQQHNN